MYDSRRMEKKEEQTFVECLEQGCSETLGMVGIKTKEEIVLIQNGLRA